MSKKLDVKRSKSVSRNSKKSRKDVDMPSNPTKKKCQTGNRNPQMRGGEKLNPAIDSKGKSQQSKQNNKAECCKSEKVCEECPFTDPLKPFLDVIDKYGWGYSNGFLARKVPNATTYAEKKFAKLREERGETPEDTMGADGKKRPTKRKLPVVNFPIVSCLRGFNCDLFHQIDRMYLKDGMRIADVTYGKGNFWKKVDMTRFEFLPSDLETVPEAPFDCRHLPYDDESLDVETLDLPYVPGLKSKRSMRLCADQFRNAETTLGMSDDDMIELHRDSITEAWRVLKFNGLLLVKCQDVFYKNRFLKLTTEIQEVAMRIGFRTLAEFILLQNSPMPVFGEQRKPKINHSSLWVFEKPGRKVSKGTIVVRRKARPTAKKKSLSRASKQQTI